MGGKEKRAGEAARLIDPLHPSVRPSHETDDSDSAETERMDREKRGRKKKKQRVEELPQMQPSKPRREKTPLRKDREQAGRKRDTSEELKEYKGLNEQELKAFRQYMQEKQGQEVCKKFGVRKHPAAAVDSVFCSPPSAPRGRGRSNLTPVQKKIRKNNCADEEEDEDVHGDD